MRMHGKTKDPKIILTRYQDRRTIVETEPEMGPGFLGSHAFVLRF